MIFPSIRARVFSLAIIPTTAASLIFFSYFVTKQINDIETALTAKGNDVASHLASASEYGIFSGNLILLSPLVDSVYKESNVVSITITDSRGNPLIQRSDDRSTIRGGSLKNTYNNNHRIFSKPIIQNSLAINDFDETEKPLPSIIGWVIVEISNDLAEKRKREATIETLLITLFILISSIFLATRISRHITTPITIITNAVKEIEFGNLEVSINTHSTGELLTLEQGIRGMLRSIKSSQQDAQQKIERATIELRDSLELLERKNMDLDATRQEALSASQAKSLFLANISHEIRTPMNGILGFVRLLNNSPLSKEQREYLQTIEQSAHNLLRIINDVLDLSKIEAGKLKIKSVEFNLRECIEDVEILMSPSAKDKNLELGALFYDDTPEVIIGPHDRIRQVLINLIGNAIKFSDRGTIIVRAMIESRNNDGAIIKLSVSDQGPGITEKNQKTLFNSFTQLDESDTREFEGVGLGLSISKSLATAMNGEIGVESRPDEGSIFWFTFSCKLLPYKSLTEALPLPFTEKSISLYDGNELTLLCNAHTFRKLGFTVHEHTSIDEFCHQYRQTTDFDLFVLNLADHESNNIPSVFSDIDHSASQKSIIIVNNANSRTLNNFHQQGAYSWLIRPFRTADLMTVLSNIMQPNGDADKIEISNKNESLKQPTHRRLDGISILIAEDNPINAKFVSTILQKSGANTLIVSDGTSVVDAYSNGKFDIILMDINMPIMNGIEATKHIRTLEEATSHIPILGLTAVSYVDEQTAYKDAGLDDVLEKPIAVDELLHEIAYWVHAKKTQPSIHIATKSNSHKVAAIKINPLSNKTSLNQLGIDENLSTTMYDMLLAELPNTRKILSAAYAKNDWAHLRNEIHRFLGGLSYCNVPQLHDLTTVFQQSLKSQDVYMSQNFEAMVNEIDLLIITTKT
ncbi:response regulator [Beggiatoa alba]|nr:response regulator [Beggiatoa alba]